MGGPLKRNREQCNNNNNNKMSDHSFCFITLSFPISSYYARIIYPHIFLGTLSSALCAPERVCWARCSMAKTKRPFCYSHLGRSSKIVDTKTQKWTGWNTTIVWLLLSESRGKKQIPSHLLHTHKSHTRYVYACTARLPLSLSLLFTLIHSVSHWIEWTLHAWITTQKYML